jgi:eukaryotic-like serine/threonine-protein kinase
VKPHPRRFQPPRPQWHRELPGRVRRYFDERRLLKWVLIAGFSCFVLGYLLMTLVFFPGFGRSPIVTVPDLTGRTRAAAERSVERLGLRVARGEAIANPRMRRGRVLMQVPLPGEEVPRGSTVRIVLSLGPEMRAVPSIQGLSRTEAIGLLQRYGFRVALRNVQDRREEGTILGLRPEVGKPAAVGGIVEMVISAGPPRVVVPGVVGLDAENAKVRLGTAGLALGRMSYDPASLEPIGTIVAQSPAAGDSLRMGYGVRVTIAGADPSPPPPPTDSAAVVVDSAVVEEPADDEPEPEPEPEEPPARQP